MFYTLCYKMLIKMNENFIIKNGWEKSGWYGNNITYIHKKWNLEDDSFFIEMKIRGKYVTIIENNKLDEEIKFDGVLKTNDDLKIIMKMLVYEF